MSVGEQYNPSPGGGSGQGTQIGQEIQRGLNDAYGAGLKVDGIYGPATKRALIRALQTELNELYNARLSVDGLFGPRTKSAIPALRRGARNNLVYILQALLYFKGYNIAVDGVYGPATERAVIQFQRNKGLLADGIAGRNTFEALFS